MNMILEIDGVRHKLVRTKKPVCTGCSLYDLCHKWERGCFAWSLTGGDKNSFRLEK